MKNEQFKYTYSAPTEEERKEIESIKRQYEPKNDGQSGLKKLKDLNKQVKGTASAVGIIFGVSGTIVFGTGLSMILELSKSDEKLLIPGIILGVIGAGVAALAYPFYKAALNAGKKKYGAEILRLSDELLGKDE